MQVGLLIQLCELSFGPGNRFDIVKFFLKFQWIRIDTFNRVLKNCA